jgi:transcriptional regulator of acetoin/glycerol metabolism
VVESDHAGKTASEARDCSPRPAAPVDDGVLRPLAEVERAHVLRVLESCGGNQVQAAQVLGIGRTTLWRKIREYEAVR